MSPRLAFAVETAVLAGKSTLAHFQAGAAVDLKEDETPVTVADRNAERLIRELVAKKYPNERLVGEEEGGDQSVPDRWIVDPIDGTKSFISGVPLYATLLSYEVDFQPVVGVAYFPALDELLYAEVGQGAYFNGRPARVSEKREVKGGVVCCGGHRSMIQHGRWDGLARVAERAMATRTWSDAYGHALVATGRVEAMLDPIVSRWDISAVTLITREAGGVVTNFSNGEALKPTHADGHYELVASNGRVHEELIEAFRS